ncbi:nitroreductase family deazaflavin-dependent oxidoreductase [soil metagenome]
MPERRKLKWWEAAEENFAKTKVGGWFAVNVANPIDKRLLRWSKGKVGLFLGQPVGLLLHTGAKSGAARETPLLYITEGELVVIVASNVGSANNPAWYHNVKANPDVRFLQRNGTTDARRAREATSEEYDALWPKVNDLYGGYETYKERAGSRHIPIVVLEPVDS